MGERKLSDADLAELDPFDPGDPFNAMADSFRTQIASMAVEAMKITIFRDLGPEQQTSCFMCGAMTAVIGVCFASISEASRDGMMAAIADYLPHARANAEAILADSDDDDDLAPPSTVKERT